ncbi:hypothetical protein L2E82_47556 [Cichorium intybus]|uniref:Uncharacterized protein n=1 Tax=Cichorium intybus TaxID=13427 RepID=A0ACB8YV19_CICIN|nr:hypothetical protein L2E82_47556 [Cichorium intybus]
MGFAITAAASVLLLRIVVRVAVGCGYACCRTLPNVPKLIRYCIFIAWFMSFAAVGQFIAGAKLCSHNVEEDDSCSESKPGIFSTAAFEALVSLGLTLFYYLVIASTQNEPIKPPTSEVEAPPMMSYSVPSTDPMVRV